MESVVLATFDWLASFKPSEEVRLSVPAELLGTGCDVPCDSCVVVSPTLLVLLSVGVDEAMVFDDG